MVKGKKQLMICCSIVERLSSLGFAFSYFWCQLSVSFFYEGGSSVLAWFFCRQTSQEGLDSVIAYVYFTYRFVSY